jgi:hypothetical protein
MDPDVVLAKTPRGAEALARQDHDLPRELRHALILIDGRSPVAKLEHRGAIIPNFPAALRELVARGLAAPVGHNGSAADPGGAVLRKALIAVADSVLGDKSGKIVKRLEDAGGTREELAAAVEASYKLIRLTIDESRAEEFRSAAKDVVARNG